MTFFQDMTDAVATYPEDYVDLEIVDVTYPGSVLNVNDEGSFRVRVTNRGALRLNGLTLKVTGRNGALVANNGAISPFVDEFVTQPLPQIAAHGGSEETVGSPLKFRAPGSAQDAKNLIKVTLDAWDPDLDHILLAHSDPLETVKTTFRSDVAPV